MNTEIKIQKGIPIPDKKTIDNKYFKAINSMKVGDSFEYPAKKANTVCSAWRKAQDKHPSYQFISRATKQSIRRVWRIK